MPASRPTGFGGDDVWLEMGMYIIDAASAQSACIFWRVVSVVRLVA